MFCDEKDYGEILTVENLMDYLNIVRTTVYKLVQSGKIKTLRIGKVYRISKKSIDEYVSKESR